MGKLHPSCGYSDDGYGINGIQAINSEFKTEIILNLIMVRLDIIKDIPTQRTYSCITMTQAVYLYPNTIGTVITSDENPEWAISNDCIKANNGAEFTINVLLKRAHCIMVF